MKENSLEALYAQLAPTAGAAMQREVGQFNVFRVEDLMTGYRDRPPMTFDHRAFYKICLIRGRSRIEYADQAVEVSGGALWFATSKVPYRWLPHELTQTGYFCVFTAEFLRPMRSEALLDDLSVFQPGGCPVLPVTEAEYADLETLFQKMAREVAADYAYKYDLLRAHLLELIHTGQQRQTVAAPVPAHSAAARLAAGFAELLERQFPLESPQQTLRLRSAAAYADQLAVHVNHLNRVLKDTTGHTTTALLGNRLAQEAKILLKQTGWTVSEIAASLGFADVAHFCHFFKRQTGLTPGGFRQ